MDLESNQDEWGADWTALPEHILGNIFGYLTEPERLNASLVCHVWSRIFCAPEVWRNYKLTVKKTKKNYYKSFLRSNCFSNGLPIIMLSLVSKRVRCLEIECPWPSEDKNGTRGISQRLSNALSDLSYRDCQLRTLVLRYFDRITFTWNDRRARLRIVKALKRFINSQRKLVMFDMRYARLHYWEVTTLLSAATYKSPKSVTSINIQGAFSLGRVSHPLLQVFIQDDYQILPQIYQRELQNGGVDDRRDLEPPSRIYSQESLGKILSRFASLKELYLTLDTTVLRLDILQHLPSSLQLLSFLVRRGEMEREEFGAALFGNAMCYNEEWKNLTQRCPNLDLELDLEGILWYFPLICILKPSAPLKRIRIYSPKIFHPRQLENFLHHLTERFSNSLEYVHFWIVKNFLVDEFLLNLYGKFKCLKFLRFRGPVIKSETVLALCWAFATRKSSISQLNIVLEIDDEALYEELNIKKYEFFNWIMWDKENNSCRKTKRVSWSDKDLDKAYRNFQFAIIRTPPKQM